VFLTISISKTAWIVHPPGEGEESRPGRATAAERGEGRAAVVDDPGAGSDIVRRCSTDRRFTVKGPATAGKNGGLIRGKPRLPSRGFDQRGLFSPQLGAGARACTTTSIENFRTEDLCWPGRRALVGVVDGLLHRRSTRAANSPAHEDVQPKTPATRRAAMMTPFDQLVRIALQEQVVLERRRLGFVQR